MGRRQRHRDRRSTARSEDWRDLGNCRDTLEPWIFDWPTDARTFRAAARYCEDCPVRIQCQISAIDHKETGIWGGVIFVDGKPEGYRPPGRPKAETT